MFRLMIIGSKLSWADFEPLLLPKKDSFDGMMLDAY